MAVMRRMNPSDLLKGKQKFSKSVERPKSPTFKAPVADRTKSPVPNAPVNRKAASRKKALQKFAGGY